MTGEKSAETNRIWDTPKHTSRIRIRIAEPVLEYIRDSVGARAPETGGALGMNEEGIIGAFHLDETAQRSGATYTPDVTQLNKVVRPLWRLCGIKFCGFVHSHPGQLSRPSHGDEIYARNILKAMTSIDRLVMPIVLPCRGGGWECYPFVARLADGELHVAEAEFVSAKTGSYVISKGDEYKAEGMSLSRLARLMLDLTKPPADDGSRHIDPAPFDSPPPA